MAGALREEREKYAGRESISDAGSIAADIEANKAALSALAELEKAASVVEIAARADAELRKLRLELADSNCELVSIRHQLASAEKVMPELFEFAERADAEIAELRRDAERYRWLRANATRKLGAELFGQPSPSYIDKAIDAARGGE